MVAPGVPAIPIYAPGTVVSSVYVPINWPYPPTTIFPRVPTPPVTCKAPVVVDVDAVTDCIVVVPTNVDVPEVTKLLPTNKFCPIPAPPVTINAPVLVEPD